MKIAKPLFMLLSAGAAKASNDSGCSKSETPADNAQRPGDVAARLPASTITQFFGCQKSQSLWCRGVAQLPWGAQAPASVPPKPQWSIKHIPGDCEDRLNERGKKTGSCDCTIPEIPAGWEPFAVVARRYSCPGFYVKKSEHSTES